MQIRYYLTGSKPFDKSITSFNHQYRYYNRFYRADGTEVTEEEEIAKYNTSFQNQDDEDALISE